MVRALEIFLEEYSTWKKVIIEKLAKAKADFEKLKKQIEQNGTTKELDSALFICQHQLSTYSYMFMEAHMRVKNAYSFYDEEQKAEIDSYSAISKKVGKFINEVNEFRENYSSVDLTK